MNMKIVGIGGAGVNILNRLIVENKIQADFVAIGTDPKSLKRSKAKNKLLVGQRQQLGDGTDGDTKRVYQATWESVEALCDLFENTRGVLILAGLGGGTGTGAAPVVAQIAREAGAAVVSLVTLPFRHEGPVRHMQAQVGVGVLQTQCDAVLKFPNEEVNLLGGLDGLDLHEAFSLLEKRIAHTALAVSDLFVEPQVLTVDLEEWKNYLRAAEKIWMGSSFAKDETRLNRAVDQAIQNPLVEEIPLAKAARIYMVLVCSALTLGQFNSLTGYLRTKIPENCDLKFSMVKDTPPGPDGIRLSLWATASLPTHI